MLRRTLLPTILGILAYGFWISPDFKEVAAGVAIFLFGMLALEEGFRTFSGGLLQRVLHRSTEGLGRSLCFGMVTTTLMQSSSLVSVLAISFLSAGMIGLHAGLGIVFGANLGTTTGAWLVAGFGLKVKISAWAMPMLAFGVVLIFQKGKSQVSRTLGGVGWVLAGIGFLFLGIHYMKEGFEAFRETIDLSAYAVSGFRGLLLYTLIGAAATVVMQSSHATLVLIITALASRQITYENGLALAIGANIGTTVTAILGALGATVEGKRLAGGHLVFNVVTGCIAIAFIDHFVALVELASDGLGIGAGDYALKLAVFHTLFNAAGVLLMAPLMRPMVRVLERLIPSQEAEPARPAYLNDAALEFGGTAVDAVRREVARLYNKAFVILAHGIDLHRREILSARPFPEIVENRRKPLEIDVDEDYEQTVKVLHGAIVEFISKALARLPAGEEDALLALRHCARRIAEAVKGVKHLRKNLVVSINSDNPYIRDAYNRLRIALGGVMRKLVRLRDQVNVGADPHETVLPALEALRRSVEETDVVANGSLDHLIREALITTPMATSLINDSSYTLHTARNLIEMAELYYSAVYPLERVEELG